MPVQPTSTTKQQHKARTQVRDTPTVGGAGTTPLKQTQYRRLVCAKLHVPPFVRPYPFPNGGRPSYITGHLEDGEKSPCMRVQERETQ